jgi:CheY-like chemotaxis protein
MKAGQRAKNLVRQILGFSRQTEQSLRPLKLTPLIRESLELLRATLPSTIAIRHDLGSGQGAVMADPTMIHQVVMNLCSNAAHAMSDSGGLLKVTLEQVVLDKAEAQRFAELEPGAYQIITVADNGAGMDQATQDRIFEPFFTTKEPGQGTGMGLAVVHGIVKSMKGAILLESAPGEGSSFHVYLPQLAVEPTEYEQPSLDQMPRGKEKVLFVDDEQALADLGARILRRLGYQVQSFTQSRQALTAFQQAPEAYDLVITDQTMPGLTGLELANAVRALRPNFPIILCTGHSDQVSESNASDMAISLFLFKPLSAANLAQAVRQVLDNSQ